MKEYFLSSGVRREAPDFEFKEPVSTCPACDGKDLDVNYILSGTGIMAVSGFNFSLCRTCKTLFVNPQPTRESLAAFYDSAEDEHENISEANRYFNTDTNATMRNVRYRVDLFDKYLSPDASILDVGCGCGVFVRVMKDHGRNAKGIDISPSGIQTGVDVLGLKSELSVCDWRELEKDRYDAVTAWGVIEHLADPGQFLKKVHDITLPGAKLWLQFPTVDSLMYTFFQPHFFWMMPPYHLTLFSNVGLTSLLNRFGFNTIATYGLPSGEWIPVITRWASVKLPVTTETWYAEGGVELFRAIEIAFDIIARELNACSNVVFICERV